MLSVFLLQGGIVGAAGRVFGKCRGIAIGSDTASALAGVAGALRVIGVLLAVTVVVAVLVTGDAGFGLSRRGAFTGAVGGCC